MNFDRMVLRSGISFFFKTSLIISTIISCVQSLNAQEMIVLNLNDCVDRALEYNYSIRQAKNNIMLSKSDNMAAFGAMLPQVSASSGNAWNTGLTVDPGN